MAIKLLGTRKRAPPTLRSIRFAGVSLAGGKTEKTAVAVIEYYPEHKKVFLRSLRERIRGEGLLSSDQQLHQVLTAEETELESIAFDVPLTLPKCIRCQLKCPGYERCKQPEIRWMWEFHRARGESKRPNRLFTPYTERCIEMYLMTTFKDEFKDEILHFSHALGANSAPLTARANFIRRRLGSKQTVIETHPRLSLWRIGRALKIPKNQLSFHKNSVEGDESRLNILKTLIDKNIAFIYQQDLKIMVENNHAFEAFICALTAFLKYRGQCISPPAGFPRADGWVEVPKEIIEWT